MSRDHRRRLTTSVTYPRKRGLSVCRILYCGRVCTSARVCPLAAVAAPPARQALLSQSLNISHPLNQFPLTAAQQRSAFHQSPPPPPTVQAARPSHPSCPCLFTPHRLFNSLPEPAHPAKACGAGCSVRTSSRCCWKRPCIFLTPIALASAWPSSCCTLGTISLRSVVPGNASCQYSSTGVHHSGPCQKILNTAHTCTMSLHMRSSGSSL